MNEILPGVFHWVTRHERHGNLISSYYLNGPDGAVLIDPRVPEEGIEWFDERERPTDIYLANRHHYRHSGQFRERYGCTVWCQRSGLYEFTKGEQVEGFDFGDLLPGGIEAIEVDAICSEETALYVAWAGTVNVADGLQRPDCSGPLAFMPDHHLGEDPVAVKRGLREAYARLLERDFDHLLLAHGDPLVGGAKETLREFISSPAAGA
jgi:hypothetical protein